MTSPTWPQPIRMMGVLSLCGMAAFAAVLGPSEPVVVTPTPSNDSRLALYAPEPESPTSALLSAAQLSQTVSPAITGPTPWVTILCRFGDSTGITPHPASWFETMMGSSTPGLDYFWREVSYGNIELTGSEVHGWYNLPQPKSYYLGNITDLSLTDCMDLADGDVNFPGFFGVNIALNESFGGVAYADIRSLTRDGETKTYGLTWTGDAIAGYQNIWVVAHEMGHGYGLPHSSGDYGYVYDSPWDVMGGGNPDALVDPTYGRLPVHTIAYHKDKLGWILPARKYVATYGSQVDLTLERLALPQTNNYLMAQVPISGTTTQFFTVEARRVAGYDSGLICDGVLIHKIDTTLLDLQAKVVDADSNGDVKDGAALWTPGEVFIDPAAEWWMTVNSTTPTGYAITLGYGVSGPITNVLTNAVNMSLSAPPLIQARSGLTATVPLTLVNPGPNVVAGFILTATLSGHPGFRIMSADPGPTNNYAGLTMDWQEMPRQNCSRPRVVTLQVSAPNVAEGRYPVAWTMTYTGADGQTVTGTAQTDVLVGYTLFLPIVQR